MTNLLIGLAVGAIAAMLLVIMWRMVGKIRVKGQNHDDLRFSKERKRQSAECSTKNDRL